MKSFIKIAAIGILSDQPALAAIVESNATEVTWPHSENSWCELYSIKYPN